MAIDWAVVFATIAGPILAVQSQKYLERRREQHQRRVWIFHTLMRTRAAVLSPDHVNALNAIPIDFHGKGKRLTDVVNAWKVYLDHLNDRQMSREVWDTKRVDYLVELLTKLALSLDYKFDTVYIRKGFYAPEGHATLESDQEVIRRGLVDLFKGERALPLDIRSWPVDPAAMELQRQMQQAMLDWAKRNAPPIAAVRPPKPLDQPPK